MLHMSITEWSGTPLCLLLQILVPIFDKALEVWGEGSRFGGTADWAKWRRKCDRVNHHRRAFSIYKTMFMAEICKRASGLLVNEQMWPVVFRDPHCHRPDEEEMASPPGNVIIFAELPMRCAADNRFLRTSHRVEVRFHIKREVKYSLRLRGNLRHAAETSGHRIIISRTPRMHPLPADYRFCMQRLPSPQSPGGGHRRDFSGIPDIFPGVELSVVKSDAYGRFITTVISTPDRKSGMSGWPPADSPP